MIKKWQRHSSKELATYYALKVFEHRSESPVTGKTHSFFTFHTTDWANIIAVTPDNNAIMVRQYRHGIHGITLEFPAGGFDAGDKDITDTIKRELLEETGYKAAKITQIGCVDTNPAFLNNKCYSFLAQNITKETAQQLDDTEDIEIVEVPITDIPKLIKEGGITHSLSIAAFYFYQQR
jgi:ADP-ribose pyrophosphatase